MGDWMDGWILIAKIRELGSWKCVFVVLLFV